MQRLIFERKGNIFQPHGKIPNMQSHAQVPFAYPLGDGIYRIYFASRDQLGRSHVCFTDYDLDRSQVTDICQKASLSPGKLGTFDDCGTMPSWFVRTDDKIYLYYTAWNLGGSVSYRLSIGLAISEDGGLTFNRHAEAPIIDRSSFDPCWVAQPCVMKEGDLWRMWYLSCTKWEMINDHPEPFYHVKYAESDDGIEWRREGVVSVDYDDFTDAIGRPAVIRTENGYVMFYSYRSATDYRIDQSRSYRMGVAFSTDGKVFERMDENFVFTGEREAWESTMQDYAHVIQRENDLTLFYNGDGFGQTGFGYAVCSLEGS